jgi:hypothetical protein
VDNLAAFRRTNTDWKLVLLRTGGHIAVTTAGASVIEAEPIYRKNDSDCCPSGGIAHREYRWNGDRLALIRSWQTPS